MRVKLKDISSFIEGNYKFFKNKFIQSPKYITEQVNYRLYKCKDTCLETGACKYCSCPTKKKVWVVESCNDGEIFPDLMNKEDWEQYKRDNKIKLDKND